MLFGPDSLIHRCLCDSPTRRRLSTAPACFDLENNHGSKTRIRRTRAKHSLFRYQTSHLQIFRLLPSSLIHVCKGNLSHVGQSTFTFLGPATCFTVYTAERPSIFKSTTDTLFGASFRGAGGLEQTETLRAAPECQEIFSAILWLNGNSEDTLLQSLATFARYTDIDRTLKSTINTIRHGQGMTKKVSAIL